MAAGLGFKDFVTGEVLTAADVDGYLMQGVWVFASAAARDAAVTSPQEGNFAYLKDTNVTTYYTGSAWANLDTTGMTNPMTTTGDTIYSSSGSTPARLGIGSTGQVLTVASGLPSWATPASGGMTLLETLTLSGASVVSSSISQSYVNLEVIVVAYRPASNGANLFIRINGLSSSSYSNTSVGAQVYNGTFTETEWVACLQQNSGVSNGLANFTIPGYTNSTSWKWAMMNSISNFDGNIANVSFQTYRSISNISAAVSTLTFLPSTGNFTSGTVYIYGVK